jgi:hypothetical protein
MLIVIIFLILYFVIIVHLKEAIQLIKENKQNNVQCIESINNNLYKKNIVDELQNKYQSDYIYLFQHVQ